MVAQAHGGALKSGGTPEMSSKGGLAAAERRRARAQRDEAIDDAVAGHIEKLSELVGRLVEEADGEQYRCTCGVLGPKVSTSMRACQEIAVNIYAGRRSEVLGEAQSAVLAAPLAPPEAARVRALT